MSLQAIPLVLVGGLALLVVLFVTFLAVFGRGAAYYRRKPAAFLQEFVKTLAASTEGAVLIMEHADSERFLQFRKPADTGGIEQQVVFGFPEVEWTKPVFGQVCQAVAGLGLDVDIVSRTQAGEVTRFAEVTLEGDRHALGRDAMELVRPVLPILGLRDSDRFTFHIEGSTWDPELQARVNVDFWQKARDRSRWGWAKKYAQRKVDLGTPDQT